MMKIMVLISILTVFVYNTIDLLFKYTLTKK